MPHTVDAVQGEAPVVPEEKLAHLEAKLVALSADGGKMQKVLNRLQAVEDRLTALEEKAHEPAKAAVHVKKH